ncbi:MAG: flagellar hook-associated protein FlgL [Syntrophales bacterium]
MVMRITENMKFNTSLASMANVQSQYNSVMEKMASLKRVNRISDDPLGMIQLLDYRQGQASIEQYQKNIDNSSAWLSMTETKLTSAGDLLSKARELAVGQGTATATAETRRIAADNVKQLKEEMLSLANSTYGSRYLFAGSRMAVAPFSATSQSASIDAPVAAASNSFDGTVTASGAYTADTNKTYMVEIVTGGTLATATYQISADDGKTWGSESNPADLATGTITLGNGIALTFAGGVSDLAVGDLFRIDAHAPGYYQGNGADLTTDIGRGAIISYNISGTAAFGGGNGRIDVFKVLDDLKAALTTNDQAGILAQLDNLKAVNDQVSLAASKVGATMNRMDIAKGNLQDLSMQLTDLTSKTEGADVASLATKMAMQQLALQASYATASKIGSNTILDFIR